MRQTFVDATVTVIDFMPKMQKVKDSRIMDLRWAAGNTLKADCERLRRAWLSVIARKWSWLGETAALWSRLSPSLDTSHIVPPTTTTTTPLSSFHPKIATARPLRNLTPQLLAAPPRHLPTSHPVTGWASGRWGGTDEEARVGCCQVLTW